VVTDRGKKMDGHCSTGQSPHWAVVPMEEEEERCPVLKGNLGVDLVSSTVFRK